MLGISWHFPSLDHPSTDFMNRTDCWPRRSLRLLSCDGGGVGVQSQLRLIEEMFQRYDWEINTGTRIQYYWYYPSFDLTMGSGLGGFAAACLNRLNMGTSQTMEEVMKIAPLLSHVDDHQTPKQRSDVLKAAIEDMLQRRGLPTNLPLRHNEDRSLLELTKVALLAVPKDNLSTPHVFRSYESRGYQYDCTFVEAVCATLAIPGRFEPVAIGPAGMKQEYISPLGYYNPTEELLKEARKTYGLDREVGLILSLGSGRPGVLSLDPTSPEFSNPRSLSARIAMDCEKVAFDVEKTMPSTASYWRMNVDHGMENINIFDWENIGAILSHTDTWIQKNTGLIDKCVEALLGNGPTIRIRDLFGIPKKPPIARQQLLQDKPATAATSLFGPYRRIFTAQFHRNVEVMSY